MTKKFPIIRLNMPLEFVGQILAEAGAGPDADELHAAPQIDLWQPILTPTDELCLTGRVTQHPLLGPGPRWAATSQLILLDQDGGWCRTASRFYRLGRLSEVRGIDMPRPSVFRVGQGRSISTMLASSSTPLPGSLRSWADREHPDFRMARFAGNPTLQNGRPV